VSDNIINDLKNKITHGDCLEILPKLPDKSVDAIICDLPYGEGHTAHSWDCCLPLDKLWEQYERIIKDNGVIALFSAEPFTAKLICSNIDLYRYSWIWEKETPTGFLNVSYAPLKLTEDICIFSKGTVGSLSSNPIRYNPQGVIEVNKFKRNNPNSNWRANKGYESKHNKLNSDELYMQKYTNYPTNILKFNRDKKAFHPTQKPVGLLAYLIQTYSNEGELILDNCSGSGSLACACQQTKRDFICIEKNEEYYTKSIERLRVERMKKRLF
jgi:site-specific DNA-methyltransferase (adenine-specific)